MNRMPDQQKTGGNLSISEAALASPAQRIFTHPRFLLRHTVAERCEFQAHAHSAFTVTVILSGQMTATIGAQDMKFASGQTVFTNPGQTHSAIGSQVEFVSIALDPILVNELVAELGLTRASAEIQFRHAIATDEIITQNAVAVISELRELKTGHEAMLETLVRQLAIHLLRGHLTVRQSAHMELSRAGLVDRRLRRAIEFMHDNYGRELALEEIAAAAYLSEYHFARLFKQITGLTPHVYLANLRLERARELLAKTALPISVVAATVGYQSQSHFTKVFKSITGITPRQYRDSARP